MILHSTTTHVCQISTSASQPVPRYIPSLDLFVLVGYANLPNGHGHHFGSSSKNPWGPWTSPIPIPVYVNPTRDPSNPPGLYPALFDSSSTSLNYDTLENMDTLYLYWVQTRDKNVVSAPDMARDLWRQKVTLKFTAI